MRQYILLVIGWAIYFTLHSVLAESSVKLFVKRIMPAGFKYYRLVYTLVSTVGLLILLIMNASIESDYLIEPSVWTRYFSLMLATIGIFILKAAFRQYSLGGFMGLKDDEYDGFKAGGILQHIRHPLYTATVLIALGFWLFIPNVTTLVSMLCIFIYLAVGIPLEESRLIKKYGEQYREYRKKVPALIPRLRKG
jgi:protein-S-isoprenylcysteine O-methyltransferase Ste14